MFLLLYFFFPPLLALPFDIIYGGFWTAPPAVRALFWPISLLVRTVPPYAALINMESHWVGID